MLYLCCFSCSDTVELVILLTEVQLTGDNVWRLRIRSLICICIALQQVLISSAACTHPSLSVPDTSAVPEPSYWLFSNLHNIWLVIRVLTWLELVPVNWFATLKSTKAHTDSDHLRHTSGSATLHHNYYKTTCSTLPGCLFHYLLTPHLTLPVCQHRTEIFAKRPGWMDQSPCPFWHHAY